MSRSGAPESTSKRSGRASRVARLLPLVLALSIGVAAGIGGYTFRYAEGLSYLSTDPRACVNCHIMQPQYDAWQKASHHQSAVCVDCHLPEAFFAKYVAKAENGWRHGEKFTTQDFVEPIVVQAAGRAILQENCIRCHGDLVHAIAGSGPRDEAMSCLHCHSNAGHGEKTGLGPPLRAAEIQNLEAKNERKR
jgi:cytochrome c nitrite reductase small subunit